MLSSDLLASQVDLVPKQTRLRKEALPMSRIFTLLSLVVLTATSAVWAQETLPTAPPDTGETPTAEPLPPVEPLAVDPPAMETPDTAPQWTYERQLQNREGTVTNTHRYLDAPDDGGYVREHVVTNPRGEMTQTWQRVQTENGYEYRRVQTWTSPDGTLLRQHEQALSGSDPYNYTREHNMTLRDGRTMSQTQTRNWDGTSGTVERSIEGPNGQAHQWQRSWTPDEQLAGQTTEPIDPASPSVAPSTTAPATSQAAEEKSWWQKMNFFRKRGNDTAGSAAASAPRRGFTIGTSRSSSTRDLSRSSGDHPSVRGSQNTHRPSWAGGAPRSISPKVPSMHANEHAVAARQNATRSPKR